MNLVNIEKYLNNKLKDTEWKLDTNINNERKVVELSLETWTPAGRDICLDFEFNDKATKEEISKEFQENYESYDVSYETYIWLDESGHGKNGAPYEMKDVLEDTQWVENELKKLSTLFEIQ